MKYMKIFMLPFIICVLMISQKSNTIVGNAYAASYENNSMESSLFRNKSIDTIPFGLTPDDNDGSGADFPFSDINDIIDIPDANDIPIELNIFDPSEIDALLSNIVFEPEVTWNPNFMWSEDLQWVPDSAWILETIWELPDDLPWTPGQAWLTDSSPIIDLMEGNFIDFDGYNNGELNDVTVGDGVNINNVEGIINGVVLGEEIIIDGGVIKGSIIGDPSAAIINAVVDADEIEGVVLRLGTMITENTIFNNPGLNLIHTITDLSGFINPAYPLFQDAEGNALSIINMAADALNEALFDTTTNVIMDISGVFTFTADNMGSMIMPTSVITAVTSPIGNIIFQSNTGEMTMTENGIEFKLAPSSADFTSFLEGLDALGITYEVFNNGIVFMTFPDGTTEVRRFTTFAYTSESKKNSFAAGAASFNFSSGDPTLDVYSTLVTYPDNTTQTMTPFIHDPEIFETVMTNFGLDFTVDSSTGVISILSGETILLRVIPDITIEKPNSEDIMNTLIPGGDINEDGLEDFYFYSGEYRQVIYILP